MIRSRMYLSEHVDNKNPHQAADKVYYPCWVQDPTLPGGRIPALFTYEQIRDAVDRARKNPEDCPPSFRKRSLLEKLFGG